ncbi:MAG: pyridoxamine 5'-phosphate oxidase family protein, partial [Flavobacteriales bacterium]|nr:pyridoxamine 5'-phosphate oxidase family protein [Flavobacteriales bacterium]
MDPVILFRTWIQEAVQDGLPEPNAMMLSTVGMEGPGCRVVLLRDVDDRGFTFFTNY